VGKYLQRAKELGLSWPLPPDMTDEALERLLFPVEAVHDKAEHFIPDWAQVHQELKRKGVTLQLLWHEYKQAFPEGYQYSWYCERYRAWCGTLDVSMRQTHKGGEKLFVDYCGQTVDVTDRNTGGVKQAQIFVAVLGASSYTFAQATWTQSLPEWIAVHVNAFEFFGGVPDLIVSDNLRSGVTTAHRYEPQINRTYEDMARHYGTAIVPARVRKPKDKAKVEKGVQDVQQRILARLRHCTFFSLAELNDAIMFLLAQHNEHPFQKLCGSRRSLFEALDKPVLGALPEHRYEYAEWSRARVNIDYHVTVDEHYYSVPYQLVSQTLDVRLTGTTVELFHNSKRVASHLRSHNRHKHTTFTSHMPKGHQDYVQWTPERLVHWAEKAGGQTAKAVATILASRVHPQQGFRACLGIMRLGKVYGAERLEAACTRALIIESVSYKSIESILKKELDKQPLAPAQPPNDPIEHDNIRGPEYYQ
jgi:transposase